MRIPEPEKSDHKKHKHRLYQPLAGQIFMILLSLLSISFLTQGQSYDWRNVPIGGGGFVTGLIFSKTEPDLLYARTDVGGGYRWEVADQRWVPLLDWVSEDQKGYLGIASIATDPHNPNKLYMLAGTSYFNNGKSAILRSDDYGRTFSITEVTNQFKVHGNGMGRQNGERLVVDASNPDILFCGTRRNGLFKSVDSGVTWTRLEGLAVTTTPNDNGICFVLPDASGSKAGAPTQRLFAGVSRTGENLYRSDDGGQSFYPVTGGPAGLMPQRAVLAGDGNLYITYADGAGPHGHWAVPEPFENGKVMKYDTETGSWTDITPSGFFRPFGGISVDRGDPERIIVSTINTWLLQDDAYGDRFLLSDDGGSTWTDIVERGFSLDDNGYGWINGQSIHWSGSIEFDPFDPDKVWVTSGNGVFATEDINAANSIWKFNVRGMEETVPLDLISIPNGPVVSAIGDYDGFVHTSITQPGAIFTPGTGTTPGLAYAAQKPEVLLRFGINGDNNGGKDLMYYSRDTGKSWTGIAAPGKQGRVAVSADGSTFLCSLEGSTQTYRSEDRGGSWTVVSGLEVASARPVADPVDPDKFYAYNPSDGKMYLSTDDGRSFSETGAPGSGGSKIIRTVSGREGHLWVALLGGGLARSTDSGKHFFPIANVTYCGAAGLGKAAPGKDYPTIFIWGTVNGSPGLYRSTDEGASWVRVNDDAHEFGGPGNGEFVVGDKNVYGRVYMSTAGRGIVYGEAPETCLPDLIRPVMQVDGQQATTYTTAEKGQTVILSPEPDDGGSWHWTGPGGFTSDNREVILNDIQPDQAGIYTAEYTNIEGCVSAGQTFTVYMEEMVTGLTGMDSAPSLSVFPNPSDGAVTVRLPGPEFSSLKIINAQGNIVVEQAMDIPATDHFLTFYLPPGLYFVEVKSAGEQKTAKILIK